MTCLFLVSIMAHSVNSACHYPLHLILADFVDSCSMRAEETECIVT